MDKEISVLVFPCGAENALEIHQALKDVVNIKIYGASGKDDHGSYVFENYIGKVPYINSVDFVPKINDIIELYKIDVIFPTHDDVVVKFAEEQEYINAKIAIPGIRQALICRSKKKTYDLFKSYSFCPKVYNKPQDIVDYPIFAKPDEGQGGKGAVIITNQNDLNDNFDLSYVYCENLPGDELTIDCFSDKNGDLRFIGPRKRERIFSGISSRSYVVELTNEISEIANIIHTELKMNGLWFFQLKKDIHNSYKLLEVSLRVAGSMNLYRGLGVNFPLLTIYNLLNYNVSIIKNNNFLEVDRALFNRYKNDIDFDRIYIDFDDTITKNGKLNPEIVFFLYNATNNNKEIYLITKHKFDIIDTLNNLKIHIDLFKEIIHLKETDSKYKFINHPAKSIFIDNSFVERREVKSKLNIPVFDVDAVTTLINWKN
jgi:hypothetical protein